MSYIINQLEKSMSRSSYIQVTCEVSVTEQRYVDGRPLFIEENINVPRTMFCYFTTEYPIATLIAKWNEQHPWQYVIKDVKRVYESDLMPDTQIWTSVFDFFHLKDIHKSYR